MEGEVKFYSIDEIEENYAVIECEDRTFITKSLLDLPDGCVPGDVLRFEDGCFEIDKDETERRRSANYDLFNSLLE